MAALKAQTNLGQTHSTPLADAAVVSTPRSSACGFVENENTTVDVLIGLGSGAKRKASDDTARKKVKRCSTRSNSTQKRKVGDPGTSTSNRTESKKRKQKKGKPGN